MVCRRLKIHLNIMPSAERIRAPRWASPRDSVPQGASPAPVSRVGGDLRSREYLTRVWQIDRPVMCDPRAGNGGAFFRSSIDVATPYLPAQVQRYGLWFMWHCWLAHVHASCDAAFYTQLMIWTDLISH